ncbi:YggT family protein [Candidatus Saccharibacteria bacterium]|nr:YggT family protein [Candidatus Saccharibacteria bacterium]
MVNTTEQVTEQQEDRDGQRVVTRKVNYEGRDEHVNRGVRVVWFITALVVTFLLVRVVLALLGANLENQFANFVYTLTDPFVAGFRGLLQVSQFQAGVSRLELETLVAALVYTLIGWGIASAIQLLSKRA